MERQIATFSITNSGTTSSYPVDPIWYADTAATDHLTNDLNKITMREQYQGKDQVQTANDIGMRITHIGHSIIPTQSHTLHLKNTSTLLMLLAISSLLKSLHMTIMSSLNFILGIFLLRTGIRETFFLEGDVVEVSIIFIFLP
jgi:hypothetical protein